MKKIQRGAVATGHPQTSEAGQIILEAGGNAFDAILASFFAACVCEPSFASLGGGGFLTVHNIKTDENIVYDFFAQTPQNKKVKNLDFYSTQVDFGGAVQEFHIGMGSMAVPGAIKGAFAIYRDLGSLPLEKIMEPAIQYAREGVKVNWMTGLTFELLDGIFRAQKESYNIFKSRNYEDKLLVKGEILRNPDLANTLELLAKKGEKVFTEGEIAQKLIQDSQEKGGYLQVNDLTDYQVKKRQPLEIYYRGSKFITNPPPSAGGILIAHTLKTLENFDFHKIVYQSAEHIELLARAMENTNQVRQGKIDGRLYEENIFDEIFTEESLKKSVDNISKKVNKLGGTTHLSAIDKEGNVASMTITNGEGSGYVIPGTGIMMNNMLGEEDLNPNGFHQWEENQRISSMMAPSILLGDSREVALGSAGSNRIRSAIIQTVVNIIDFNQEIDQAINNGRIHFENGKLDIEPGFSTDAISQIKKIFQDQEVNEWDDQSLFFGGANCVGYDKKENDFFGAGDNRRGGKFLVVE
jgi:gamma-glutamyltranspeptidase/glutathione hydrolase